MKKIILVLLLTSAFSANAQNDLRPMLSDTLGKYINLPEIDWYKGYQLFSREYKAKGYIISDTVLYYAMFKPYPVDSLPVIDFSKDELYLHSYCPYCLHCPNGNPCHRNACSYNYIPLLRKKKVGN